MKPSKQVKSAFRAWKKKTTTTQVSLKEWARNHDSGGTEMSNTIQQWFANKKGT